MSKESISSRLQELFDLYKSGAITEEEYKTLKSKITGIEHPDEKKLESVSPKKEVTIPEVTNEPDKEKEPEPIIQEPKPPIAGEAPEGKKDSITKPEKKKSKLFWIIGVVLAIVVAGGLLFVNFYKKNNETKVVSATQDTNTSLPAERETNVTKTINIPQLIFVDGGSFIMGCTTEQGDDCWEDENPNQQVYIDEFYIGRYEVTIGQFRDFIDDTSYITEAEKIGGSYVFVEPNWEFKSGINWRYDEKGNLRPNSQTDYPVIHVSWNDADAYCKWLSERIGGEYFRLPFEAEWEFAARGGIKSNGNYFKYSGSNIIGEVGWHADNSSGKINPVGLKKSNQLGIYDMSGNVWEWCYDWYGLYDGGDNYNPTKVTSGESKVLRGGGWMNVSRSARVSHRGHRPPNFHSHIIGFRVVREVGS